jgi:hypothetical protein
MGPMEGKIIVKVASEINSHGRKPSVCIVRVDRNLEAKLILLAKN